MSDYDFSQLSPHDFELMCRDLLQVEWGLVLESFKAGKDGGIDFRYAQAGKQIIVQCKRFVESGFSGLLRELRKEADKVRKLKPGRYVLMTAAPLSDANKTEIVDVIGAQFLVKADIFGCADLNNLLGRHSEVERSHYKLWLASTNVLETMLHNDIITQSDFQVEKIHSEIKRYVQGNAYPRALVALKSDHVVILSGLPGVGKTTLANMLLYEHLANGFEPIIVREDFAEGKAMLRRGKPQIFYFDDFMGTTFLGDRGSSDQQREYRAALEFIEMVGAAKDKRLILTTREQMLHQAWNASEQIRNSGLMDRKVVIHMGDYSMQQRAEIFYNHVFFSDLPPEYRDELLKNHFYLRIIKHDKFNPRLIEWLSSYRRLKDIPVDGYQRFVAQLLQDPAEIWRHAFDEQISDAGRSLLLTMFSFGSRMSDAVLREGFAALHAHRAQIYGLPRRPNDYTRARVELHGAFVRPTTLDRIEFINPSLLDWLNRVVCQEPQNAVDLIMGAACFTQVAQVWNFVQSAVGGASREVLRQNIALLAPIIGELALAERAIPHAEGVFYRTPSYEERLATLIRMADTLRVSALLPAIGEVIARIKGRWSETFCDIKETVTAVKAYEQAVWQNLEHFAPFFKDCVDKLITTVEHEDDWDLNTLHASLEQIDYLAKPSHLLKIHLKNAFEVVVRDSLSEEISRCGSYEDVCSLIDTLEYLGRSLGVDVRHELSRVREAHSEYFEYEYQYSYDRVGEYRENERMEWESDESIREMFRSLRAGH
ncbi:restriction endonuclease [Komagataeibacter sp. FNDCR2]|uniref:nSTAND3 domain-containing NTPase n=1 Tax=Komagataeibacter sp. FNDCR2 TaxID=2878682 RepID=UPI001E363DD2|nr:restriction endonuclease [Komagataeibacter sp. FNDCR2]MCE2574055.1 restriction endonuclease [Komagataeibacter sp. FNDCR2]